MRSDLWNNPPRSAAVEAFVAILSADRRVQDDFLDLFRAHDLNEPKYDVLRILRNAGPVGLACREVGQKLYTRVPDVTRLVDGLERLGLVRRERSDEDRRVVRVSLTRKGLQLLRKLDQPVLDIHARQFEGWSDRELRDLARKLDRVSPARSP